jgi:hypothetical protein
MGGVAGHMDHLYDNPDLSFSKMKEIMTAASNAELDVEEKVDGQNLFLSYSIPENKAKGARNKGNLKAGGLDARALADKFAGRGNLEKSFNEGFKAFEDAVSALSYEEKKRIFGPNTDVWYNAEIMDPSSKNVINYDGKTLKVHGVGHFLFDKDTGDQSEIPEGALETLDNALDRMQKRLVNSEYSLARKAIINLERLESDSALKLAISRINKALAQEGLSDSAVVQDYIFRRLLNGIETDLPDSFKKEIVKYLMKLKGNIGLRELKKRIPKEELQDLQSIVASKPMLLKEAIFPIEVAVHDFTVEVLKGLESVFIVDTGKEVDRLRKELSDKVNQIIELGPTNPQAVEIMQKQLNKIKDMSQVTTPVEALVFDYDGHTYKFAGNFAPLNQILGMFRYESGDKKLATEAIDFDTEVITDKDGKKVALLPGGFKPPHAGHYQLAKELESLSDIDEVIVIIGRNSRFSDVVPKIEITAEQSKNLWDIYTKKDKNINVRIQEGKTPVADVYDLIADKKYFSKGDTVILGKSDKDEGDKRYARAQSWAERNNPGVNVEEMIFPVYGGGSMGGTQLRDMVASGQKERFLNKLPTHLRDEEKESAWNSLTASKFESFDSIIDSTIEEMSTMSSGAVEGGGNGFGPVNKYNVYRRPKKPKVKKAKRQRRR